MLVKLMLQQSLSSPFYIVKQKITSSLESLLHAFIRLPSRPSLYSNRSGKIANKPMDWSFHHIDGGVTNNNESSNIKHMYFPKRKSSLNRVYKYHHLRRRRRYHHPWLLECE